jgi:CRP/FNR family transcriptional regulator, cyclic AMP receptor protein
VKSASAWRTIVRHVGATLVSGRPSAVGVHRAVRSSLLDQLELAEREALVARLRRREYKRGQVVFNDGDIGDCLHLVQHGRVHVQLSTRSGQPVIVRVVHPGEFFGELALVHSESRRVGRVCALEPTETLALHRHDFDDLRAQHRGLDRLLVRALSQRLEMTSRLAVELLMPPEARLWRQLLLLADAYGDEPIRMSQDELAYTAGTVRQTANRVLHEGVRRGILTVERRAIRVLDRAAVERLSRR